MRKEPGETLEQVMEQTVKAIETVENMTMPNKQLKMIYGWVALHQEELEKNWYLAQHQKELFSIDPLK